MKNKEEKKGAFNLSSPFQFAQELDEMNEEYRCPVCDKHVFNDELSFVADNGMCMSCENVKSDIIHDQMVEEEMTNYL